MAPASRGPGAPARRIIRPVPSNRIPGFLPSTCGLRFANRFPAQRTVFVGVAGRTLLALGNAADGLCGGMCDVVRTRFESGLPPWPEREAPPGGSAHFRELVAHQIDSFRLGRVPLRFYDLMAARPDRPTWWSRLLGRLPRPRETIRREWPRIRADIDAGRPSMIGLVRVSSADPRRLGDNHQVLGYGYTVDSDRLSLAVYDPNHPLDDTVEVLLEIHPDRQTASLNYSTGEPLLAVFRA
jgi:hypothetical protein